MSCSKSTLVSEYLDKEMNPGEKTAFDTHLRGCNDCAQALEEMRSLRAAFVKAERYPAPYGFATRVMARAAELEKKKTLWQVPFFVRFAEAAVLFVVITVGILAGKVMTNSYSVTTNVVSSLSLDVFDAVPPGSLGGAYIVMTEVRNEK